jgi:hypothetical protein
MLEKTYSTENRVFARVLKQQQYDKSTRMGLLGAKNMVSGMNTSNFEGLNLTRFGIRREHTMFLDTKKNVKNKWY